MLNMIRKLKRSESGVTAIEYGLIAGLIAVLIIGGVSIAGTQLQSIFSTIATQLSSANTAAAS